MYERVFVYDDAIFDPETPQFPDQGKKIYFEDICQQYNLTEEEN